MKFLTLTDTRPSMPGGHPLQERLKLDPPCRQLIVTETQLKEKMKNAIFNPASCTYVPLADGLQAADEKDEKSKTRL